jgi:hypothetical protein
MPLLVVFTVDFIQLTFGGVRYISINEYGNEREKTPYRLKE